ncbi:MAG: hypothetical protein H6818_19025 [Phycisphaerales bacterium]|nr:hypothetical protein [Phycisphaerales bacterium]MCB9863842.1 hypothetical protein [Phycisphaerales bacterium]
MGQIRVWIFAGVGIGLTIVAGFACRPASSPTTPAKAPAVAATAPKPMGKFLFQPYFHYEFKEPSIDGSGFFVRTENNRLAAIIAASCVKFDETRLTGIHAISIGDWTPIVALQQSWGLPGDAGTDKPVRDYRNDYLIMPVGIELSDDSVLDLDVRAVPVEGEPVWFPNKVETEPRGYEWIDGVVDEVQRGYIRVRLDTSKTIRAQGGAPIVSGTTGKVIGTLSRAEKIQQKSVLWLCPAPAIRAAMKSAQSFPALKDVVGGK